MIESNDLMFYYAEKLVAICGNKYFFHGIILCQDNSISELNLLQKCAIKNELHINV